MKIFQSLSGGPSRASHTPTEAGSLRNGQHEETDSCAPAPGPHACADGYGACGMLGLSMAFLLIALSGFAAGNRKVLSLDGEWQIAEGRMDLVPTRFDHQVPVPGLVDMARPPFAEVGTTNSTMRREAFWYRRTFRVEGEVPAVARLKIHKAAYGVRVYLNGSLVGEHLPSFTPGYFDVRAALRGGGVANELLVRVGAFRTALPPQIPDGWDFEKVRYIPGIFDSVELILSGTPHLVRVQAAPDIGNETVRIQALLLNAGHSASAKARFTVREARSHRIVGAGTVEVPDMVNGKERMVETSIPVRPCHRWSPDDPFLYELEVSTDADTVRTRFGMREFRFDPATGHAMLNGKPWFLRGSNVTLYRFFEDAQRGDKPWRADWVRRLHRRFKEMHWHALRYCIGFPPDFWYDIADEEGFLIQDEFPLWHLGGGRLTQTWPAGLNADELAREYTEWMQERWNHPSVVVWDAQNETTTEETGKAIQRVRGLDRSNRPWDNGWGKAQAPGDSEESHPYLFSNPNFKLADLARVPGRPVGNPNQNPGANTILLNEYGWLWLNRDGTPTTLTRKVYENLLGAEASSAQRRYLYARYLAALTEFWRCHRACAGVLHFCGLGYSRPDGQTSDHWTDLEKLTYEPNFHKFVRDAFAPVGLMIDEWAETLPAGIERQVPVVVINDLSTDWRGTLRLRLWRGAKVVSDQARPCEVAALGDARFSFTCEILTEPGSYRLEASLVKRGAKPVRSLRDFTVRPAPQP